MCDKDTDKKIEEKPDKKEPVHELDPYEGMDPSMGWDESEMDDSKDCGESCVKL